MLRVVFDSECDEELRVGDEVVYERSLILTIDVSEHIAVVATIIAVAGIIAAFFMVTVIQSYSLSVDSAVPG